MEYICTVAGGRSQKTSSAAKYRLLLPLAATNFISGILVWWTTWGRYTASTGACQSSNPRGKYSYRISALSLGKGRLDAKGCCMLVVSSKGNEDVVSLGCTWDVLWDTLRIFVGGAELSTSAGFFRGVSFG